jgi:hypothetical protein
MDALREVGIGGAGLIVSLAGLFLIVYQEAGSHNLTAVSVERWKWDTWDGTRAFWELSDGGTIIISGRITTIGGWSFALMQSMIGPNPCTFALPLNLKLKWYPLALRHQATAQF